MNTQIKHTPGPWSAYYNNEGLTITNTSNVTIAYVDYDECEERPVAANAALIAAAPVMYADGKVLCGLVRDFMNDNRLYDGQVIQAIHNLETALAQAEGKP